MVDREGEKPLKTIFFFYINWFIYADICFLYWYI